MLTFLLWLLLLVVAWPLALLALVLYPLMALLALVLYPLIWLIGLPLRLVGISVRAVLDIGGAVLSLPARILRGPRALR